MTVFSFKKAFPSQKVQCSQHCSFLSKYSFSRRKYFKKDLVKIHPRTTKYPSKQKLWELPQDNISTASWIYEACFPWQWGSTVTLSWAGMMPLANQHQQLYYKNWFVRCSYRCRSSRAFKEAKRNSTAPNWLLKEEALCLRLAKKSSISNSSEKGNAVMPHDALASCGARCSQCFTISFFKQQCSGGINFT